MPAPSCRGRYEVLIDSLHSMCPRGAGSNRFRTGISYMCIKTLFTSALGCVLLWCTAVVWYFQKVSIQSW